MQKGEEKKTFWGPTHLRDPVFLDVFFRNLKVNRTGEFEETFPHVSVCAGE
jgi:hypothetical protein